MAAITLTIDDAKLPEFKLGFLRSFPVPLNTDGTPQFTENAWIKRWAQLVLVDAYRQGKTLLAQDALSVTVDNTIVT